MPGYLGGEWIHVYVWLNPFIVHLKLSHSLLISYPPILNRGFPLSSVGKESACNAGHPGLISWSGNSPGEGNDNLLLYSCL